MPLEELLQYETALVETVLDILKEDDDIDEHVGTNNITKCLLKNKLPYHYNSRAIQVKDPSTDFTTRGLRSQYKEFASSLVEIYCYENIIDDTAGQPLNEDRLLKTVGLVLQAFRRVIENDGRINGFYWFLPISIGTSETLSLLQDNNTFDLVGCKTILYDIRKDISL